MKKSLLILFMLAMLMPAIAQKVKKITIPDIPDYITLKGDFHTHTVFSDGSVWPDVRIGEAKVEGIDVVAITDHIEYRPHLGDVPSDHNRSYDIAKLVADKHKIILIKAAEITRSMPPGHLNALFITDAAALAKDDFKSVVKEVKKQGGFILWNHPGWKSQQPDTIKWFEMHTWLYENGLMNGIEIYNSKEYYPVVFDWALQKKLTIFANSDSHSPTAMGYDLANSHRPVTLIFAKERSEEAVKEALIERRTAAFTENMVRGNEEWLKPLFSACVKQVKKGNKTELNNLSGIDFELEEISGNTIKPITLKAEGSLIVVSGRTMRVKNFEIAPEKCLEFVLE